MLIALYEFDLQQQRTDRLAHQTQAFAMQLQAQRLNLVRLDCEDINQRHDSAINTLYEQLAATGQKNPQKTAALTIALIDAILPQRNCDELVAQAQSR
ncbi:MAG: hypothetical protein JO299_16000 [Gammaproteobacteria bacterium]|nr:hypothetical protein [Gammaproteobacteria bacterium]